jgi:hypothetical protein
MTAPINEKLILEAIDRIARTPDGVSLYLYCQRRMMAVAHSSEPHTLQRSEGERTFALQLIGLMTKGLIEGGGRPSISGPGSDDEPIIFAGPKPIAQPVPRGAGRRIDADTRVPGWDYPDADAG